MSEEGANSRRWFVKRGDRVAGPFDPTVIRRHVVEGRLSLEDEVSLDRQGWRSIGGVREVMPLQFRDGGRDAAEQAAESSVRQGAGRNLLMLVLVLAALVALAVMFSSGGKPGEPDCGASASPRVVWSHCRMDESNLAGADLVAAQMDNTSLINANLSGAQLVGADLRYANLAGANLAYSSLREAWLKGTNLRGADLTNTDLTGADLAHADLTGAHIGGAVLAGVRWHKTIWVDGSTCPKQGCGK